MDADRLTFALPRPERQQLEALARDHDLSLAQLVRRGVRMVLAAELDSKATAPVLTLASRTGDRS